MHFILASFLFSLFFFSHGVRGRFFLSGWRMLSKFSDHRVLYWNDRLSMVEAVRSAENISEGIRK